MKHVEKRHWNKGIKRYRMKFGFQKQGLKTKFNERDLPQTAIKGKLGQRIYFRTYGCHYMTLPEKAGLKIDT